MGNTPGTPLLNGADELIQTLLSGGITHCFANPGTSEMHLVQAIDRDANMKPVLCLFEGVCTGAADGYARVSGQPAATLLHLGPGLANGIANLHNARRAGTPILNLVGDHPAWHRHLDAPLTSDVKDLARTFSCWSRVSSSAGALPQDAADAMRAMRTRNPGSLGQIATLIIPANCAWESGYRHVIAEPFMAPLPASNLSVSAMANAYGYLNNNTLLLLDNNALTEQGLRAADIICQAHGCRFACVTFPARIPLGPHLPKVDRMPYFPEHVQAFLKDVKSILLVGAEAPVSFFAYQDLPGELTPPGVKVGRLTYPHEDSESALIALAGEADLNKARTKTQQRPALPEGHFSVRAIIQSLAAQIPEDVIISADSGPGGAAFEAVQSASPVLWINLTGGSIGQGGPAATGAALASRGRRVVALLGDGGAMYTVQYLWTQAREKLNVTSVIFSNRSYQILDTEYRRLGNNEVGSKAASMFDLGNPDIDWVSIAAGYGVPGFAATTTAQFNEALAKSFATSGPTLIEAII